MLTLLWMDPQGKRRVSNPSVIINADKNVYALGQDVLAVLDRACQESIPMLRDDKPADALTVRHGPETDDYNRDFIERDEKRLADLGRRTVEMYVIAHIIADLEVASLGWLVSALALLLEAMLAPLHYVFKRCKFGCGLFVLAVKESLFCHKQWGLRRG